MEAVEYLRQKKRMCHAQERCGMCPARNRNYFCFDLERADPAQAVQIVEAWAAAHPVEPGVKLIGMDAAFVQIYIECGYLWAARNKSGELRLYRKEPKRLAGAFKSLSPTPNGCRAAMSHMLPGITWENSPVCLPKLLEGR